MDRPNKKRSSILKKSSNDDASPTATFTKSLRRISFSGKKSVKEFIAGDDKATIWGTSYEESANAEQSTSTLGADEKGLSNADASKKPPTIKSSVGSQNSSSKRSGCNVQPIGEEQEWRVAPNSGSMLSFLGQKALSAPRQSAGLESNLTSNNVSGSVTINGTINITLDPNELELLKFAKESKQRVLAKKRSFDNISCSWDDLRNISPTDTSIEQLLSFGVTEDEKYLCPKRKFCEKEIEKYSSIMTNDANIEKNSNIGNETTNDSNMQLKTLKMSVVGEAECLNSEVIGSVSDFHTRESKNAKFSDKNHEKSTIMQDINIDTPTQENKIYSGTSVEEANAKFTNNRKTVLFVGGQDLNQTTLGNMNNTRSEGILSPKSCGKKMEITSLADDVLEITCLQPENNFVEEDDEEGGKGSCLSVVKNIDFEEIKADTRKTVLFNSEAILDETAFSENTTTRKGFTSGKSNSIIDLCDTAKFPHACSSSVRERPVNDTIEIDLEKTQKNEGNSVDYDRKKNLLSFKDRQLATSGEKIQTNANERRTVIFNTSVCIVESTVSDSKTNRQELTARNYNSRRGESDFSLDCSPVLIENRQNCTRAISLEKTQVNRNNDLENVSGDNNKKRDRTVLFSSTGILDQTKINTCKNIGRKFFDRNSKEDQCHAMDFSNDCSPVLRTYTKNESLDGNTEQMKLTDRSKINYIQNTELQLASPLEKKRKNDGTLSENLPLETDFDRTKDFRRFQKDRKTILFKSGGVLDESTISASKSIGRELKTPNHNTKTGLFDQMDLTHACARSTNVKQNKADKKNTIMFNASEDLDETSLSFCNALLEDSVWIPKHDPSMVGSHQTINATNIKNKAANMVNDGEEIDQKCEKKKFVSVGTDLESQGKSTQASGCMKKPIEAQVCLKSDEEAKMKIDSQKSTKQFLVNNSCSMKNERLCNDNGQTFIKNEACLKPMELDAKSSESRKTILFDPNATLKDANEPVSQKDKQKVVETKRRGTILFENAGNLDETTLEPFDKRNEIDEYKEDLKNNRLKQRLKSEEEAKIKIDSQKSTKQFLVNNSCSMKNERVCKDNGKTFIKNEACLKPMELDAKSSESRKTILFDRNATLKDANEPVSQKDKQKVVETKRRETILFENAGNLDETTLEPFDKKNEIDEHKEDLKNNRSKQRNLLNFTRNVSNPELKDNRSLQKSTELFNTQICLKSEEETAMELESPQGTKHFLVSAILDQSFLKNEKSHKDNETDQILSSKASSKIVELDERNSRNRKTIIFECGAPLEAANAHTSQKDKEKVTLDPKRRGTILFENTGNLDETILEPFDKLNETSRKNPVKHSSTKHFTRDGSHLELEENRSQKKSAEALDKSNYLKNKGKPEIQTQSLHETCLDESFLKNETSPKGNQREFCSQTSGIPFLNNEVGKKNISAESSKTILFDHAAIEVADTHAQQKDVEKKTNLDTKRRQTILFQNDGDLDETIIEPINEQNRTAAHEGNRQHLTRNSSKFGLKDNYSKMGVYEDSTNDLLPVADFCEENQNPSKQNVKRPHLMGPNIQSKIDRNATAGMQAKCEPSSREFSLKNDLPLGQNEFPSKQGGCSTTFYDKDTDMDAFNFTCHEEVEPPKAIRESMKPDSANVCKQSKPESGVFTSEGKLNETDFNFSDIISEEYVAIQNPPANNDEKPHSDHHKFASNVSPSDIQMSGLNLIPDTTQNEVEMFEVANEEEQLSKAEPNYSSINNVKKSLTYSESKLSKFINATNDNDLQIRNRKTIIFKGTEATISTELTGKSIESHEQQKIIEDSKRKTLVFKENNDLDITVCAFGESCDQRKESPSSQSKFLIEADSCCMETSNKEVDLDIKSQKPASKTPQICFTPQAENEQKIKDSKRGTRIFNNDLCLDAKFENKENVDPGSNVALSQQNSYDKHGFQESHIQCEESSISKSGFNKNLELEKSNIVTPPPHGAKSSELKDIEAKTINDSKEFSFSKTTKKEKDNSLFHIRHPLNSNLVGDLKEDSNGIMISNRRGTIYFKSDGENNMEITICGEESEITFNAKKDNDIPTVQPKGNSKGEINFDDIGDFDMDIQDESFPAFRSISMEEKNLSTSFIPKKSPKKALFLSNTKKSTKDTVKKRIFDDTAKSLFNKTSLKDESLSFNTPNSSVPNMLKKIPQSTMYLYNAESQESLRQSNTTYYPDTTEALCNLDPSRIEAWRRKTQAKRSGSIHKKQPEENVRKHPYRKSLVELTCESIIISSDNDDDIVKSKSSLIETEPVHDEIDLIKESQRKDSLDVTKNIKLVEKSILETSINCASCTSTTMESDPKKGNIGNGKCPKCHASFLGNDTTFDNLVAKLQKDLSDLSVNFEVYEKFRQSPSFEDIFRSFKKKHELDIPERSFNESICFPITPPKAFLLKNYMESFEVEERVPIPLYPKTPAYEFLIKNRLKSENSVWLLNTVYAPIDVLEFRHKAVRSITIFVHFRRSKRNEAKQINFKKIEVSKCKLFKKMSAYDTLLQNEVLAKLPHDILEFSSCDNDLFVFLERLKDLCEKSLYEMQQFLKVIISGNARLIQNENNECFVSKTVRKATYPPSSVNIKINVKKIKRISLENVILPPKCSFNEQAYALPPGLDFLSHFLKHPDKYYAIET